VGAPRDLGNAATPWEKDDTIRAETGLLVAALDDVLSLEHVEPLAFVCGDVLLGRSLDRRTLEIFGHGSNAGMMGGRIVPKGGRRRRLRTWSGRGA